METQELLTYSIIRKPKINYRYSLQVKLILIYLSKKSQNILKNNKEQNDSFIVWRRNY